jgi:predicted dinucleotide-binding enzyme
MKRLFLDFRRTPPARPAGYLVLAAGLAAAGLAVAAHLELNREVARLDALAESAMLADERGHEEPLPIQGRSEKEALENARNVVGHLTVPWDRLFAALEAIQEKQVALLSITPNVQKRQIRIYAEAKTLADMLAYHRGLEESAAFAEVALTEHEVQLQDPEKPVRFNILATWSL